MAVKFTSVKCPECGANLPIEEGRERIFCSYCGTQIIMTNEKIETKSEKYEKEYGFDEIEIQENSIAKDDVILIHDDLLATGGSMKAAYNLVQKFSPKDVFMNFIFELKSECPDGRKALPSNIDVQSLFVI